MIFKNNNFNKNDRNKGIALLFSVILSSVLFTVAMGIIKISLEEIKFNPLAQDTNDAFYAADVGAECALFNDVPNGPFQEDNGGISIPLNCFSIQNNNLTPSYEGDNTWTFTIIELGKSNEACAVVTFRRIYDTNPPIPELSQTLITSKGYPFGDLSCGSNANNRAERAIMISYEP